jgi:hypothetical protein
MKKFFAILSLLVVFATVFGFSQQSPKQNTGYVGTGIATSFGEWNNTGVFHVNEEVTPKELFFVNNLFSRLFGNQPEIVRQLFQIKGVVAVEIDPHRILVKKTDGCTWQKLRPQIEEVLVKNIVPTPKHK